MIVALLPLLKDEDSDVRDSAVEAFAVWLRKNNPGGDFYFKKEVLSLLVERTSCLSIQENGNSQNIWQGLVNLPCYTLTFSSGALGNNSFKVRKEQKKTIEDYFKKHALLNKSVLSSEVKLQAKLDLDIWHLSDDDEEKKETSKKCSLM